MGPKPKGKKKEESATNRCRNSVYGLDRNSCVTANAKCPLQCECRPHRKTKQEMIVNHYAIVLGSIHFQPGLRLESRGWAFGDHPERGEVSKPVSDKGAASNS
jgi:hypothetical protein